MSRTNRKEIKPRLHPTRSRWHKIEQPKSNYNRKRDKAIEEEELEEDEEELDWFFNKNEPEEEADA